RSWWPGKVVQLAPYAVTDVDWHDRQVKLNVTRDQVKSAPAWDPLAMMDEVGEQQLHRHFGWPGYGG
ncbi:MAG: PRC-barrel domain containing protein, partial [Roseiarcus sp.]